MIWCLLQDYLIWKNLTSDQLKRNINVVLYFYGKCIFCADNTHVLCLVSCYKYVDKEREVFLSILVIQACHYCSYL